MIAYRRLDAFELWCWRRLLRVPWIARRFNQSILKEISPEYSLERLMLKLKLQYFGHLMWKVNSLEKDPDAGKDWSQKEKEGDSMRWLYSITDSRDLKLNNIWEDGEGKGSPGCCSPWGHKGRTRLSNWTTTMDYKSVICVPILRNKKIFLKKQKTVIQLRTFTSSTLMPEGSWRNVQRKQLLKTSQIIPASEVLQGVCEREGKCVSDFCCWELTGDLMASRS